MKRFESPLALLVALALLLMVRTGLGQSTFVNFEGKQTSPVRLSPDGSRLFAVNTPDNRLSVFDLSSPWNPLLIAEISVGLEPVSVNALNNDEVWVVNEVSDSVSIVSVSQHVVTDTIPVKDEPADIVFAMGRAFVTAARNNRIVVIDTASHAIITNIAVFGENPRALAVNTNGTKVYAAFALSGNRTTLVPFELAPPQPTNGMRADLPPPPQTGLIVDSTDPDWTTGPSPLIQYTLPDNDVVEIDTSTLAITRYFPRVGTVNFAIAVRPGNGDLYVASTDARNLTRFEPALRGAFVTNQLSRIRLADGLVTRFDLNPGVSQTNFPSLRDKTNALAQPSAMVFGQSGNNMFVAAFGSDRVALVDANTGVVSTRIELCPSAPGSIADPRNKRGPRGLALKPGTALYVLNRISNTLTVIDPMSRTVVREISIGSYDPTPAAIRKGRGFLYDAKLSGNGTVSCASCHVDADMDLLAWDLGNPSGSLETNRVVVPSIFHPMKGPMTTQTLRGLKGLEPLHWRGDRTNFLHFNGAFENLMGGSVLPAQDMLVYREFINTLVFHPNPNQNLDGTLPTSFAGGNPRAGFTNFTADFYTNTLSCNACHTLPSTTARVLIRASALARSQDFKVPHLRNVYQKVNFTRQPGAQSIGGFGFANDGAESDLVTFLSRPFFGHFATNPTVKTNLQAFLLCIDTGTAPAVGYARTLTVANRDNPGLSADWDLLEAQAAGGTNIDLVLRGKLEGRLRGFRYDPNSAAYLPDTTQLASMTRAELRDRLMPGDALTLLGVPPGSGIRLGVDRELDGVLDGDAPGPALRIFSDGSHSIVAWPTNPPGFVLERAARLPATNWAPDTSPRGVLAREFTVTNTLTASNWFFRLREL